VQLGSPGVGEQQIKQFKTVDQAVAVLAQGRPPLIFDVKGSINTAKEHTVAATKMELAELLSKADGADADWLREGVRVLAQALMDAEVSAQIGADHGQRTPERITHRNGYRPTGVGHPGRYHRTADSQAAPG
jgi:hypothetical protein